MPPHHAFCIRIPVTQVLQLPAPSQKPQPPSPPRPTSAVPPVTLPPQCRPQTAAPVRTRKPPKYWNDRTNLLAELRLFMRERHSTGRENAEPLKIPTVSELRLAGRHDLIKAIGMHGGFSRVANLLGLSCTRRSRLLTSTTEYRVQSLREIERAIYQMYEEGQVTPGYMPTSSKLRALGQVPLLNRIVAMGGFYRVAAELRVRPQRPPTSPNSVRHAKQHWTSWKVVESELRAFAHESCDGYMPLQRQLVDAGRTDLLNGIRHHGGLSHVARRAGLQPSPETPAKRPRGYWQDVAVVHAELLTFTARYGHPGLMPRRDQLFRAGRADLAYAIERHGGFANVSASLHLVWHGPSSFWRVFRNFQRRLLAFLKMQRGIPEQLMPNVQVLHKLRRLDLVYGVAIHGGVMKVAKRIGLTVVYGHREETFWQSDTNVKRELEAVLRTQPLEARRFMPSSVLLVQLGRADLATGIRDHGGWVYYAQKLGLRFAFDVRAQGFWQKESNVVHELLNYVDQRYGDWEHPGIILENEQKSGGVKYIPSLEMLKRDGRSDIAFAIERFHGGIDEFARKHDFHVAKDVVESKPAEYLQAWERYSTALQRWIDMNGFVGMMPTKHDLITTGRFDLRYATYKHGGFFKVSQRLQLVYVSGEVDQWLPCWLGLQAAKLGTVLNVRAKQKSRTKPLCDREQKLLRDFETVLNGSGVGRKCDMIAKNSSSLLVKGAEQARIIRRSERRKCERERQSRIESNVRIMLASSLNRLNSPETGRSGHQFGGVNYQRNAKTFRRLSKQELDILRKQYKHLPPNDLIRVN